MPCRSWCQHSITGKAKERQHYKRTAEEDFTDIVHMDYAYVKTNCLAEDCVEGQDEVGMIKKGVPIIVIKGRKSNMLSAQLVPPKGVCP